MLVISGDLFLLFDIIPIQLLQRWHGFIDLRECLKKKIDCNHFVINIVF